MPGATPAQRQTNLVRLRGSLTPHCPPAASHLATAHRSAARTPLTHATAFGNLEVILGSGALLSQVQSGRRPGRAETLLGTADDVFLYAAAFTYPDTECGFLFKHSVEDGHATDGVATPFDSGAFAEKIPPPPPYADGVSFVRDHEVPVSDYRTLLGDVMSGFSPSLEDYLSNPGLLACSCGTVRDHPFGFSGGDRRMNTFEVRIPQRVALQPPHLLAIFVREGFEPPALAPLYAVGVVIERYTPGDDNDFFHAMRLACVTFVQNYLSS